MTSVTITLTKDELTVGAEVDYDYDSDTLSLADLAAALRPHLFPQAGGNVASNVESAIMRLYAENPMLKLETNGFYPPTIMPVYGSLKELHHGEHLNAEIIQQIRESEREAIAKRVAQKVPALAGTELGVTIAAIIREDS